MDSIAPRIGYVVKRFPRLSETFILNELLELERQGVEVTVFSLLRPPDELRHASLDSLRARVVYLPSSSAGESLQVREMRGGKRPLAESVTDGALDDAVIGKSPADTVTLGCKALSAALLARSLGIGHLHAHFASDATSVAMLAARLTGLGYSFTAHARDIYHTYTEPARDDAARALKIARSSFTVTVSDYNARHLQQVAGPSAASKVHRLYNGIDLQQFPPVFADREPRTILGVGRLVEKKGFVDLVEACARLQALGRDFECRIIGEGPLREQLESRITALRLNGRVHLLGSMSQERLRDELGRATVFALPCVITGSGDRDGLPTVLLEAQARGLACVSTAVAGIPEIICDGQTGLLCPPGSPEALAVALERLLADVPLRQRIAAEARKAAEQKFSLTTNVGTLKSMFAAAIQGREA